MSSSETCICCLKPKRGDVFHTGSLAGVTSDQKPWPIGGEIWVCAECGHVQKTLDDDWRSDTAEIYAGYDIFRVSGGNEQLVFRAEAAQPRSVQILQRLTETVDLPSRGKLLDVGCGKGAFLSAFSASQRDWELAGHELGDNFREVVLGIPGVSRFYTGPIEEIEERFDLITLMHVLEHVDEPAAFLRSLSNLLTPNGLILVQVPYLTENHFDLVVRDHCSHFEPGPLESVARSAGFSTVVVTSEWATKELSYVGRPDAAATPSASPESSCAASRDVVRSHLDWLNLVDEQARDLAAGGSFALFGTATAGSWLGGLLGDAVTCFVDEDPNRCGNTHLGKPVIHPSEVDAATTVYVALPPTIAARVAARLQEQYPGPNFAAPPLEDRKQIAA